VHPICPLILSCSNLLLLHDLRILKPINVQFITPPAFGLEYFPDGQFFLLSGEPIRIGNTRWVRTLMNGMSRVSRNGKHVVSSDMNGKICLWDWRDST
jgi:WD40 repeat protein